MITLTQPLVFEPIFMPRVWGGRRLASLYAKKLPAGEKIGESWELVDRPEAQSVVHEGFLRGKTLQELWRDYREPVFGARWLGHGADSRFPLLIKLLDAEEKLSVQVHPPAEAARSLGGEPKTEAWIVTAAAPEAELYAGLRAGVTREQFEHARVCGAVAELLHRLPVRAGDAIFIPSGRIHAIGAGNVIVEVQQNSDTTYRVFDWNRKETDGKPRALHIAESMQSIDFQDFEPRFLPAEAEPLVECEDFRIHRWTLEEGGRDAGEAGDFAVVVALSGAVACAGEAFGPGEFFLLPASLADRRVTPVEPGTQVLCIRA